MNINQKRLWVLIKEIIEICNEADIPWFLSGRTAMRAYEKEVFYRGFLDVELTIPAEKVHNFFETFKKKQYDNRVIESLCNNFDFPGFYLRYIDTESTLIRMNDGRAIKNQGLFIRIELLKKIPKNIEACKKGDKYLKLIKETAPVCVNHIKSMSFLNRMFFSIAKKIGRQHYTKKLFNNLIDIYSTCDSQGVYVYSSEKGEEVEFPEKRFTELVQIIYKDMILYLPYDINEYLERIFDGDWKRHIDEIVLEGPKANMIVEGANNIVSSKLSFEYLIPILKRNGLNKRLFRMRKITSRKNQKHKDLSVIPNETWNLAQRAGDLWLIYDEYNDKIDIIQKLFEAKQLDELKVIFNTYDEIVRKYEKLDMGFFYNIVLWNIYLYLLESYGEGVLVSKLKRLVENDDRLKMQLENMRIILESGESI